MITKTVAQQNPVIYVRDKTSGKIVRTVFPSDVQIGLSSEVGELHVTGRFTPALKTLYASGSSSTVYIDNDHTIAAINTDNHAGTLYVKLPDKPRNGQIIYVKDASGAASSKNIIISSYDNSLIDSSSTRTISTNWGIVALYWDVDQWKSLQPTSSGGSTDASYITYTNEQGTFPSSKVLTSSAGMLINTDSTYVTLSPQIVAGDNITLQTGSGGWLAISASSGGGGAPTDATYLTLTTNATLTNERVFTAGTDVFVADTGAGSTYTVNTLRKWTDGASKLKTTSSVAISADNNYASDFDTDTYFYVSGTSQFSGTNCKKSIFGGDLYSYGNIYAKPGGSTNWIELTDRYINFFYGGPTGREASVWLETDLQLYFMDDIVTTPVSLSQLIKSGAIQSELKMIIPAVGGVQTTDRSTFQAIGAFDFTPTGTTSMAPSGSTGYSALFMPIVENMSTGSTTEIALFNVTSNSYVANSTLSTTAVVPTLLTSANLSSSLSSSVNIYEVHMRVTSEGATNRAYCKGAKLQITWYFT